MDAPAGGNNRSTGMAMKKRLITAALGVAMALPGVAIAKTVVINTDSTVGGGQAFPETPTSQPQRRAPSAPPLPSQPPESEVTQKNKQTGGVDWLVVGEDGQTHREKTSSSEPPAPRAVVSRDASSTAGAQQASITSTDQSASKASEPAVIEQRWALKAGLLKEQVISWGEKDGLWDVVWEGSKDIQIGVSHNFYGDIDDAIIGVVKALANNGAPIRLKRARANHKLIIRSGK